MIDFYQIPTTVKYTRWKQTHQQQLERLYDIFLHHIHSNGATSIYDTTIHYNPLLYHKNILSNYSFSFDRFCYCVWLQS